MILQKILNLFRENDSIQKFLTDSGEIEILYKNLDYKDVERLVSEYSNLFDLEINNNIKKNEVKRKNLSSSILSITLINRDNRPTNYIKLKKIKIYIDQINENIIKILEN